MLKYILLASTVVIAQPALAQDAQPAETTQPAPDTTAEPVTEPAEAATAPVQPAAPAPAEPAAATQTVQQEPATAPVTPAEPVPAQPAQQAQAAPAESKSVATTPDQVAAAVKTEFPTYDLDKNAGLNKSEFTAWIGTLRKANEPAFQPNSPEATAWFTQAFSQADADKSASISEAELSTFLTPKPS